MKWKEFVADYLSFTRRDRVAILVIVALVLAVIFVPEFYSNHAESKPASIDTAWTIAMKKLEQKEPGSNNQPFSRTNNEDDDDAYQYDRPKSNYYTNQTKAELFFFDPNTISEDGWKKLGLRDKTIHTIQTYLSKGGHFKEPGDLQKIYGLHPDEYDRLTPYIKIKPVAATKNSDEFSFAKNKYADQPVKTFTSRYAPVDINAADTTAFIALPGIGNKLAARIINFRDKLGGFYAVSQVGETFGLPDSTFQKIKQYLALQNTFIKKININTATVDELKAHPYIRWNLANPIIAYRNEHGPFSKIEDIKNVMAVTDEIYNKVAPYLIAQ
jgi:competence protein ComEA